MTARNRIALLLALCLAAALLSGCVVYAPGGSGRSFGENDGWLPRSGFHISNWSHSMPITPASGVNQEQIYALDGAFTKLSLRGQISILRIHLQNGEQAVRVQTDKAYLPDISLSVADGTLYLTTSAQLLERAVDVYITAPDIASIQCSGAAELLSDAPLTTDTMRIDISGACSGNLELDVNVLEVSISGAGSLNLSGRADDMAYSNSGASKLDARDLQAKTCDVDLSGAGFAQLRASEKLRVRLSGMGKVEYWGSPELDRRVSGMGLVERMGD